MRIILLIMLLTIAAAFGACSTESNENGEQGAINNTEAADSATNELPKEADEGVNSIEAIQERYAETMQAIGSGRTDSSYFKFDCHGERSGTITYHWSSGDIIMIEKKYGEYSHTEVTEQYFIAEGEPYFIFHKTLNWVFDSNAEVEGGTRDNIQEERYYILNNKLVRCLEKEYVIRTGSKYNPKPEAVENKSVDCPSMDELMKELELLLSYKGQTGEKGCL